MEHILDVSMLEPCEPLERTLEQSRVLQPGDYLKVIHRREPHLLYPLLEELGLNWHCREVAAGRLEIFIWRSDDQTAAAVFPQYLHIL